MLSTQVPHLYLKITDKGRSVFTAIDIPSSSLIEVCPVILLNNEDRQKIHDTVLHDYYFMWDMTEKSCAIALGYGSLYNHSKTPNAEFEIHQATNEIHIKALEKIASGEEILVKYIADDVKEYGLWF